MGYLTQNKYPKGWIEKRLGDVCKTTSGGTPSRKRPDFYNGDILWVKSGELKYNTIYDTQEKITKEAVANSSAKLFPIGTLLIALYGATIGKLAILGAEAATNQAICGIFESKLFKTRYLYYYLFHKRQDLVNEGIGGAQPNISQTILKDTLLPIPPLPEQHRIVSKIEELFSELDNGIANLKKAKDQLKVYRQSVLKWAFEGRLTDGDKSKPEWKVVKLKDVVERISDGPFGSNLKTKDYVNKGIRVIRLENIGVLEFRNESKTFITAKKYETIKRYTVGKGDIIFSSFISDNIRVTILPDYIEKAVNKADCFLIRVSVKTVISKFLVYFLSTKGMYNQLVNQIHGATRPRINTTQLKASEIPLPSLEEQHQIVHQIESRLSVADKLEETIEQSLKQSEALRQSILKRAFEGKLVPQEETDR